MREREKERERGEGGREREREREREGKSERERERERARAREMAARFYCIINELTISIVGEQKDLKEKNNNKQTNRDVLHWLCYAFWSFLTHLRC